MECWACFHWCCVPAATIYQLRIVTADSVGRQLVFVSLRLVAQEKWCVCVCLPVLYTQAAVVYLPCTSTGCVCSED